MSMHLRSRLSLVAFLMVALLLASASPAFASGNWTRTYYHPAGPKAAVTGWYTTYQSGLRIMGYISKVSAVFYRPNSSYIYQARLYSAECGTNPSMVAYGGWDDPSSRQSSAIKTVAVPVVGGSARGYEFYPKQHTITIGAYATGFEYFWTGVEVWVRTGSGVNLGSSGAKVLTGIRPSAY